MFSEQEKRDFLHNIVYTIFRRKWSVLTIAFLTFFFILFATFLVTPKWKATALLMVDVAPRHNLTVFPELSMAGTSKTSSSVDNLVLALKGKNLAYEVVKKFGLAQLENQKVEYPKNPRQRAKLFVASIVLLPIKTLEFLGILAEPTPNYVDKAAGNFMDDWADIKAVEATDVISVTIYGETRQLAMDIANYMAREVTLRMNELVDDEASETIKYVERQIEAVLADLHASEGDLRDYKKEMELVTTTLTEEQKNKLARLGTMQEELKSHEIELVGLLVENQDAHPDVQVLKTQIGQQKLQIDQTLQEISLLPEKEMEMAHLIREVDLHRSMFADLRSQHAKLQIIKEAEKNEFGIRVIDWAFVSEDAKTDWPIWPISVLVALIIAPAFALGYAFFAEYWNDSLVSRREFEKNLGAPVLGKVFKFP